MSKISSSPERHTFQAEGYVKRCKEEGKEPSEDYLNLYKSARQLDEENMVNPEWQANNLEYDLRSTDWILEKVRASEVYAQNLYASMCNNDFQRLDLVQVLKDERWSCSWRRAGGIIADMRCQGDYIDWYCTGIRDIEEDGANGYVSESTVTEEIKSDLEKLGWLVVEDNENY